MVNRANGRVTDPKPQKSFDTPQPETKAEMLSGPDDFRRVYASADRTAILANANRSSAGYGFYGEHLGNNLFAPPQEFGGDGIYGDGAAFSPADAFSNPFRYQMGGGIQGQEGWAYGTGSKNIDHARIAQCVMLYKTEGIVQRIVHLLADFVVENIDIAHPDVTVHQFYQAWMTKVDLKARLHRFTVDLLTTGNVFIWTQEARLKDSEKRDMKRGIAAELIGDELVVSVADKDGKVLRDKSISINVEDDELETLKELKDACRANASAGRVNEIMLKRTQGDSRNDPADPLNSKPNVAIPWRYTSLNPLQMEPRGSRFANEHKWVMLLHKRDMKPMAKYMNYRHYSDIGTTKVNIPEIFKGKLNPTNRKGTDYVAELELDPKRLSVIQDVTKADHEMWATPQILPAVKEVQFKRMLRQGEISAMESMKHMITLIKLGDTKEGFIPTEEQIERVAAALAGGSQSHHLIWDDLIKGEVLQPNIGNIFDPKKYEQVDKDIYASLGVSENVFTGNASYSNSFLTVKLLLEKLETIRNQLGSWLRVELKKIADAMKFKRLPILQWGFMSLRDENAERKLYMDLYDRGVVSEQTLLQRFGTDFDIELERQKLSRKIKKSLNVDEEGEEPNVQVMIPRGPFIKEQKKAPPIAGKNNEKEQPQPAGRPPGTGKPLEKQRETKPQGLASIARLQEVSESARAALNMVTSTLTDRVTKAQDVKDSRSLTKAQKNDLEELILMTFASIDLINSELNQDLVYKAMNTSVVTPTAQKIVDLYKESSSQASTKEERFSLMVSAYAAIYTGFIGD
jgi:hypothetical protein